MPDKGEYEIGLNFETKGLSGVLDKVKQLSTLTKNSGVEESVKKTSDAYKKGAEEISKNVTETEKLTKSITRLKTQLDAYKKVVDHSFNKKTIEEYNKKIADTEKEIKKVQRAGGIIDDGKIKKSERSLFNLKDTLLTVGRSILSVFAVDKVLDFVKTSFMAATAAEGIEKAFARLNKPGLLDELRNATSGTVSDLELMKNAVKASNFQIPLDQMGKLLQFASQRARDTGDNVGYLVESIVLGISRNSIPILDNLGLSSRELTAEFAKTGNMAQAVGNIIDRSMTSAGDGVEDLSVKMGRLSAIWDNFTVTVGKGIAKFVSNLLDSPIERFKRNAQEIVQESGVRWSQYANMAEAQRAAERDAVEKNIADINALRKKKTGTLDLLQNRELQLNLAFLNKMKQIDGQLVREKEQANQKTIKSLESLRSALKDASAMMEGAEIGSALFLKSQKEVAKLQAEIDAIVGKSKKDRDNDSIEREKKIKESNDQIIKLQSDLNRSLLSVMEEGREKEKKELENDLNQQIKALEAEKALSNEAAEIKKQLISSKRVELSAALIAVDMKYNEKELKIAEENSKRLVDIMSDSQDKEIAVLQLKLEDELKFYDKIGKSTVDLVESYQQDIVDIKNRYRFIDIDESEKKDILAAEIMKLAGADEERLTEAIELKKLQITIKYANERLDIIKQTGAEGSLEMLEIEKIIYDSEKKINKIVQDSRKRKPSNIFELIGINKKDAGLYQEALSHFSEIANDFFNELTAATDRQISEKQRLIDALTDQITETERQLDRELELQEQGYANNVDAKKKEIDDLKMLRDQQLAEEKELQNKRDQQAKAQAIADTALQAGNLITASAGIFKSFAGLGPFGIPLAIAMIATMFGSFAFAKIKAFNATKTSMAEGGPVGGKSHAEGGNKYMSMDGNDNNIVEIEKGEFVVTKDVHKKNPKFFQDINSGRVNLSELLNGTGVYSPSESIKDTVNVYNNVSPSQKQVFKNDDGVLKELQSINKSLNKNKDIIIDSEQFTIVKKGNVTKRYAK